jgi:hypothetical protein
MERANVDFLHPQESKMALSTTSVRAGLSLAAGCMRKKNYFFIFINFWQFPVPTRLWSVACFRANCSTTD